MATKVNYKREYNLFVSWLKTMIAFHIFGRFKDWDEEVLDFFEKHFNPKNRRDLGLKNTILDFNRKRIANGNNAD